MYKFTIYDINGEKKSAIFKCSALGFAWVRAWREVLEIEYWKCDFKKI